MSLAHRQLLALALTLAAGAAVLLTAGTLLLPFIVALLLALLLYPLQRRLRALGLSSAVAAAIGSAGATAITLGLALGVVPMLAGDAGELSRTLVDNLRALSTNVSELWGRWLPGLAPLDQLIEAKAGELAPSVESVAPALLGLVNVGGAVMSVLLLVLIVPVALYFFLKEGRSFRESLVALVPRRYQAAARDLSLTVADGLGYYIRGQALVCAWQAAFHAVGLTLIGLQFGVLIGLLTGLSALVPIVGNAVMFGTALIVAVAQFDGIWPVLAVVAIYGAAQLLETLFLVPVLVGSQIKVHPLLMLTAVLLGGRLFGFVGALLALPGTTVIVTAARWFWMRYRNSDVYTTSNGKAAEVSTDEPARAA